MKYFINFKYFIVCGFLAVSFMNCSELHVSSWNCVEAEGQQCLHSGDIDLLDQKSIDMLMVLDNSSQAKKINSIVKTGLGNLIECMEPVNLRVGFISASESESMGELLNLEIDGQISQSTVLTSDTPEYKKWFKDTVSFDSGCDYPPYCNSEADLKPLTALHSFMERANQEQSFLRDYSSLFAVVIVSTVDEMDSPDISNITLESIYGSYTVDQFMAVTVTDLGKTHNCLYTSQDKVADSLNFFGKAGATYGILAGNPGVALAGGLLDIITSSGQKKETTVQTNKVIQFASQSGGKFFDICEASFGRKIAQDIFRKANIEQQLPAPCKRRITSSLKEKKID